MARTRVDLDRSAVAETLSTAKVRAELRVPAEQAASAAQASAPVVTGRYRDSIHVEDDTTDRAVARVVASAPHAIVVEARTGNLARALGSIGG